MVRPPPERPPDWEPPPDSTELESELPPDSPAAPDPEPPPPGVEPPGKLLDDARALYGAGLDALNAWTTHFRALKRLFLEEFALARDATVAALVFLLLAMVLIAIGLGLLTALFVVALHWAGLPWMAALAVPALLAGGLAWIAFARSRALFRYADFESTRRQIDKGISVPREAEVEE